MKQIEYYLDFMELLDGAVVVRGWAADRSGGEVQFQIRDKEKEELLPIRLRRLERIDVAQSVLKVTGEELKDSKKCALGFELRFSITGAENYELIMAAGNVTERIRISLKKLKKRKEKSYLPWKKMWKMTTLSMLLGDGKALIKKGPSELKYRWERYETEESRYGKWLNRHLQYEQEPLNEKMCIRDSLLRI